MIMTWAGVARLAMEIRRYCILANLIAYEIRELRGHDFSEQVDAAQSHLKVLDALESRNEQESEVSMREHLEEAAARAVKAIFPRLNIAVSPKS